jgi:putative transposase
MMAGMITLILTGLLRGVRIHGVKTAPRSSWQNPYVERLIGTLRRDSLDHVVG